MPTYILIPVCSIKYESVTDILFNFLLNSLVNVGNESTLENIDDENLRIKNVSNENENKDNLLDHESEDEEKRKHYRDNDDVQHEINNFNENNNGKLVTECQNHDEERKLRYR